MKRLWLRPHPNYFMPKLVLLLIEQLIGQGIARLGMEYILKDLKLSTYLVCAVPHIFEHFRAGQSLLLLRLVFSTKMRSRPC